MSTQTTNLQLTKPDENDFYEVSVFNNNADIIDEAIKAQEDTITELKKSVSDGKTLVANAITAKGVTTSKDATFGTMATNINAIQTNPTLQAKTATLGTSAQTIKADSGYDGLSQVTVPGVSGTAVASNVLKDKTFSSASGVGITGTMVNNGAVSQSLKAGGSYTIPAGYHNGTGKVTADTLANQTPGTATATQILTGQTAWVNGQKITGTMRNMTGHHTPVSMGMGSNVDIVPSEGYYNGVDANVAVIPSELANVIGLTADKLVSGNTILGITGTAIIGKRYATGTVTSYTQYYPNTLEIRLNGTYRGVGDNVLSYYHDIVLPFEPSVLVFKYESGTGYWRKGVQYGYLSGNRRADILVASTTGSEFELPFTSTSDTIVGWVNANSARIPMVLHYSTSSQSMTWEAWA